MKTNLRNYSKLVIVALALTLAFSATALANGGDKETPVKESTEFKFIGNINNQPVFELNLINSNDEYTVTFRDEAGNVLYNGKFQGATGSTKKFMLKSDGFSDINLNVVIRSKKNNTSEVYAINTNQISVAETVITKTKIKS